MNKLLELIIEDYKNQKQSAESRLALNKVCELELSFTSALNEEQRAEYLKLEYIAAELFALELDDFAVYLFEFIKKYL